MGLVIGLTPFPHPLPILPAGVEPVGAQTPGARLEPGEAVGAQPRPGDSPERGPWWTLWSWQSPNDRILLGNLTMHVYELDEPPANNWPVGVVYRGLMGVTFVTTHGPRGWSVAFERAWLEGSWGPARTMVGFRGGLVYGYDDRLFPLAGEIPILPYVQPLALMRIGPATLDFTWTWVVFSLNAGFTFW